jgi:hypothetical protein
MGDAVVIAGARARWCSSGTCYRTQTPSDCGTNASAMPAAGYRADHGPSARSEQAATDRSLGGIVRVRVGRRRQ